MIYLHPSELSGEEAGQTPTRHSPWLDWARLGIKEDLQARDVGCEMREKVGRILSSELGRRLHGPAHQALFSLSSLCSPRIMTPGPFPTSSPQCHTGQAAEDNFEHQKPAPPRFASPAFEPGPKAAIPYSIGV